MKFMTCILVVLYAAALILSCERAIEREQNDAKELITPADSDTTSVVRANITAGQWNDDVFEKLSFGME